MSAPPPGSASTAARPRPPRGAAATVDLDVATGHQLVEVVAGHVGVELEALGHGGGGDAVVVLVDEEVDLRRVGSPNAEVIAVTTEAKSVGDIVGWWGGAATSVLYLWP